MNLSFTIKNEYKEVKNYLYNIESFKIHSKKEVNVYGKKWILQSFEIVLLSGEKKIVLFNELLKVFVF